MGWSVSQVQRRRQKWDDGGSGWGLYYFHTKSLQTGGLKTKQIIVSQFWGPESEIKMSAGLLPPRIHPGPLSRLPGLL